LLAVKVCARAPARRSPCFPFASARGCTHDERGGLMDAAERVRKWFVPLSRGSRTLGDAYGELRSFGLQQGDIPYIIQLVENPRFDLPGIDLFHGAADLCTHDYIHIVLGRGLLAKDEAFV